MSLLVGERISLRPVAAEDGEEFVARARESVRLHHGLIFAPTNADEFTEYLGRFDRFNAVGFVIRLNHTRRLAGFVNINDIAASPAGCASLGFGGFAATRGQGYVAEAVPLAIRYAFMDLHLRRLDAWVQPRNTASVKVVRGAGLRRVPGDRRIIHIDGEPREHERWTLTADGDHTDDHTDGHTCVHADGHTCDQAGHHADDRPDDRPDEHAGDDAGHHAGRHAGGHARGSAGDHADGP